MAVRIGNTLRGASEALVQIVRDYSTARARVINRFEEDRERLNPATFAEERDAAIAREAEQARAAIDELAESVDAEEQRVRREANQTLFPQPSSTEEALLVETKRARYWGRFLRVLDQELARSGGRPDGAVDAAIEEAMDANDREAFVALREELPSWLRSLDMPLRVPTFIAQVDKAMQPLLSDEQVEALATLEEVEIGTQRVADAIGEARQALRFIDKGTAGIVDRIPGWGVDEDVAVAEARNS